MRDARTAVSSLRRRIAMLLFWRYLLPAVSMTAVLCGIALLLMRRAYIAVPWWSGWIVIAAVLLFAAERARRRLPHRDAVVALIDSRAAMGGLLMAGEVMPLGAWQTRSAAIPRVVWRNRRLTVVCALCLLFAVGAAFVPEPRPLTNPLLALGVDLDRLHERIALLREEELLPAERAEAMTTTLERLRAEAAGDDPARAWETLDSLDEATLRTAREAAEATVEKAAELTRNEVMAQALQNDELDPAAREAGKKDFAAERNVPSTALTPEQLQAIAESAKAGKAALRATLEKLRDAGLIDGKTLRDFERAAEPANRAALARFLKENSPGTRLIDSVGEFARGKPGVERGRGDAPLFFGEESKHAAEFREETLPPASAATLANSELVGLSAAAPSNASAELSTGGALTNAQAGGGSAVTPVVQPRHRGTVRRFFERNDR